jgi:hypothetical protein
MVVMWFRSYFDRVDDGTQWILVGRESHKPTKSGRANRNGFRPLIEGSADVSGIGTGGTLCRAGPDQVMLAERPLKIRGHTRAPVLVICSDLALAPCGALVGVSKTCDRWLVADAST